MSLTFNHSVLPSSEPVRSTLEGAELADAIKRTVTARPKCSLELLFTSHPGLTWNQMFLEIDRMSRSGELLLTRTESGEYNVTVPGFETNECVGVYPHVVS